MYRAPKEGAQQAFSSHLTIVPSDALFFCDFLPCPGWVKYDLKKVPPLRVIEAHFLPREAIIQASYLGRVMGHLSYSDQHTPVLRVPPGTVCMHFQLSLCIKLCQQDAWHRYPPLSLFPCLSSIKTREICHPALLERNFTHSEHHPRPSKA